ncbi:hypothetical protein MHLP_01095 [Candidatus Mycoplasma haematolamae str. Purdue]|uniref:Uncharacterized protein n=1 Tax=Mycoplasma haematolamae (strain Purdue) TaxID=1212765 RepID=I7CIU9_MYCHA|nr:hypothetical protein [Candidatus Mycoplasma haematolamae]AFO51799.1 hypothetical protein MHLP_01095 [Candidatus Mycoplasma haematolamae str. Purdue]
MFKESVIALLGLGAIGGTVTTVAVQNSGPSTEIPPSYVGKLINYKITVNEGSEKKTSENLTCSSQDNSVASLQLDTSSSEKKVTIGCSKLSPEVFRWNFDYSLGSQKVWFQCKGNSEDSSDKTITCEIEGKELKLGQKEDNKIVLTWN